MRPAQRLHRLQRGHVSTGQSECQPFVHGVGNGVVAWSNREPVLVVTEHGLELSLGLRLRAPTPALDHPSTRGVKPQAGRGDPPLSSLVPMKAPVTAAASNGHAASRSNNAT